MLEALKVVHAKLQQALEDMWLERETYRELLIRSESMTEEEIDDIIETVKNDPAARADVRQHFSQHWTELDEAETKAAYELHLSKPPKDDKPN
jgi:hypothetical protein